MPTAPYNPLRARGFDERAIEDLFTYHDPESGLRTMPNVNLREPWSASSEQPDATVDGNIYGPKYELAGSFSRHLRVDPNTGDLNVHHDSFVLEPRTQDRGFSRKWLQHQFPRYAQAGVKRVTMLADIDVGAYAWHKHGFVPDPEDKASLRKAWQNDLGNDLDNGNLSSEEYTRGMKLREPHEFASFDVGRQFPIATAAKENTGHYGKAFYLPRPGFHGARPWHGSLTLDPTDEHYQRGVRYRSSSPAPAPEEALSRSMNHSPRHRYLCERGHIHYPEGLHLGTGSDAHCFI